MFRRLVRFSNRPFRSPRRQGPRGSTLCVLAAASFMAVACSGEISSPDAFLGGAITGDKVNNVSSDPNDPSSDPGTTSTRPPGVGDPASPNGVGWTTRFPKLSNAQWENTVQDLFLLAKPVGASAEFTQERLDQSYVSMAAAEAVIAGNDWGRYQTAAEKVATQIVGDDAQLAKITPTGNFADANAKGTAFIAAFGRRAYRRPLTDAEKASFLTLFKAGATIVGGDAYKAGVRVVLEGMLQSPFFLYRVESAEKVVGKEGKAPLTGNELAVRLSYALWNSMPSDELMAAASAGELDTKEGVARWAGKLLDDPRAKPILLSFHEQTFQIATYGTQIKDASLSFDADALAPVLKEEARKFFELVLDSGGGIAELLTEPTAFVNETTAPLYGLTGVTGQALQKKALDPATRAGLLTQVGFLSKNATRKGSDPVHRGLMVARKVLCDNPDPPPKMFELPTPVTGLTTREVYEKETACGAGCHDTLINPPGFAFEGFDAIGKVRTTEAGKPIDATGMLTIRQGYTSAEKKKNPKSLLTFDGPVDLVTQLAAEPRVHECYARNWMEYVLAREVDPTEKGAWEALREASMSQASVRSVLLALVQLDTFRTRVSVAP
ncbi:MAG: hypothetical protein RLZZ450_4260 [Pseudomonadota bacterium]